MRKIVKEINGISWFEREKLKTDTATGYHAEYHDPWKPCYTVIENAHDCYGETSHGTYDTLEEAEKWLEIFCKINGGRIEESTWGEFQTIKL